MDKYSSKNKKCYSFIGHPRAIQQNILNQISLVGSYLKRLAALAVICEVESRLHGCICATVTSSLHGRLEVTPHHLESNTPLFIQ